jgi:hypothetical protein
MGNSKQIFSEPDRRIPGFPLNSIDWRAARRGGTGLSDGVEQFGDMRCFKSASIHGLVLGRSVFRQIPDGQHNLKPDCHAFAIVCTLTFDRLALTRRFKECYSQDVR